MRLSGKGEKGEGKGKGKDKGERDHDRGDDSRQFLRDMLDGGPAEFRESLCSCLVGMARARKIGEIAES